jgi:preprotein translocase subunit SecE
MEQLVNKPSLSAVVFAVIFIASLFMLLADQAVAR